MVLLPEGGLGLDTPFELESDGLVVEEEEEDAPLGVPPEAYPKSAGSSAGRVTNAIVTD